MQPDIDTNNLNSFLTFPAGHALYALPVKSVRFITSLDAISLRLTPGASGKQHQVFDFEGNPITLLRFSHLIGMKSYTDESKELVQTLAARKQDHIHWIESLEHSIRTGEEFVKARDPHKCAFGQWYDHFHTTDDQLGDILKQFDKPHKRIHSLADKLLDIAHKDKNTSKAIEQLDIEKNSTLKQLLELFEFAADRLQDMLKPVVVILEVNQSVFAIEIDSIKDMQEFSSNDWLPDNSANKDIFYEGFFQKSENELFLKVNPQKLFESRLHT